jgi:hypothetical protein
MTYRDVPLLHSAQFEKGPLGQAWYGKDKDGHEWMVVEDDHSPNLIFTLETSVWAITRPAHNGSMTRAEFQEKFGV